MASTSKDEFVETDRAGIWQYYLREKKEDRRPCVHHSDGPSASFRVSMNAWSMVTQSLISRPCVKNAALLLNVKADLLVGSIHINEPNTITTR